MAKQSRDTLTTRFLMGPPPDGERVVVAPGSMPDGRAPIPRLGISAPPKAPYTDAELAHCLRSCSKNSYSRDKTLVICDTNLFIDDIGDALWSALLAVQITVLPPVYKELQNVWMGSPRYNTRIRDLLRESFRTKDRNAPFLFTQLPVTDKHVRTAVNYYVNLLAVRKRAMDFVAAKFQAENGRDANPAELQQLIHKHCGERGYQLARRAANNPGRPFPFADEELIVTATFLALLTGNELLLITRDSGIQEQFYKFVWLLDTHYRGMLLAQDFRKDRRRYRPSPIAEDDPRASPAFEGSDNLLLERTPELYDELLPDDDTPLPLHCLLLGVAGSDKVANSTVFCADRRGFCRLIWTKGETGGLNSDQLSGLNCHPYLFPLPFHPMGTFAAVAKDRLVTFRDGFTIPWLDFQQSLFQSERFRRVSVDEEADTQRPNGGNPRGSGTAL